MMRNMYLLPLLGKKILKKETPLEIELSLCLFFIIKDELGI